MALPETVRVKLSSEAAGSVSITPVVLRDIPIRELVEQMLGITGKDQARVHELLLRGALVSGASRFRWTGWDADRASLQAMLDTFPDPEPDRPFSPAFCTRATLQGRRYQVELPREVASRKPLLKKASFWDLLMAVAEASTVCYADYSYKDRADRYRAEFSAASAERLRNGARILRYSSLQRQISDDLFESADLYVSRP